MFHLSLVVVYRFAERVISNSNRREEEKSTISQSITFFLSLSGTLSFRFRWQVEPTSSHQKKRHSMSGALLSYLHVSFAALPNAS
ncbi:MAG: hypothetical protein AB8H47_15815, partial [Bacteroidia bacterium]